MHIHGARFREPVNLSNATLLHPLLLEDSYFEQEVDLLKLKSSHLIELGGSKFQRKHNVDSRQVDSSLLMSHAEFV